MKLSELDLSQFENLEEFSRYVEAHAKLENDKNKLNELRYKVFTRWHDEYGFMPEDEEYIIACSFTLDTFETDEEWEKRNKAIVNDAFEYEQIKRQISKEQNDEIKKVVKETKSRHKRKREYQELLRKKVEQEKEVNACLYRAYKSLKRKNTEDNFQLSVEELVKEAYAVEPELDKIITREELYKKAEEFQGTNGANASFLLKLSSEEFISKADDYIDKNQKMIVAWSLIGLTIGNLILLLLNYVVSLLNLQQIVLSNNPIYIVLSIVISAVAWIYATTQDYFNFENRKWLALIVVIINDFATLIQIPYTIAWNTVVVFLMNHLKIGANFTINMAVALNQLILLLWISIWAVIAFNLSKSIICADEAKNKIIRFKYKHMVDTRQNKESLYDFNVLKDQKSGKKIIVKMEDLFTHLLLIGASGTGKTSSIFIPQIVENIRKKMINLIEQQKKVLKLVQDGDVVIEKPFSHDAFNKEYFKVINPSKQSEFDNIFKENEQCGITVVAPNNSMNEDILAYCSNRGIWVNNLDPSKKAATYPYERLVGMNPFYMPSKFNNISKDDADAEEERTIFIAEAANNFADALTAINELNGSGDQYFTDVNTTVTSAVATVLMLHASITNTQTTIDDVYNCISNFDFLKPIVNEIKRFFNIKHEPQQADNKRKPKNNNFSTQLSGMSDGGENLDEEEKKKQQEYFAQLSDEDKKNPYIQTIMTVETRLQKGMKMDEHAEGLRNLIGKLLQDPRVKRVLVNNKDILDFNQILEDNAITVVNTALEFGKNTSTCFGQLFLLNFNSAVLRRPKNTRTPHFLYEDETARYLSDTIDTMVTLYRQYRVSCMFALQSLDQVEKVPKLAYLKQTLLSAGTTITFGRASNTDAEEISKLGGQERYNMIQHTKSYAPLLSESAHTSFSDRSTPTDKNYVDPSDVRYRDFQECTIITTDQGNVLPARIAKANFVPKEVLFNKDKEQINQNDAWKEIWRSKYPLTEEIVTVNAESTVSPKTMTDTASALRKKSSASVSFHNDEEGVSSASTVATKNITTLKDLLNTNRVRTEEVNEDEISFQITGEDIDNKDFDFFLDEEVGFDDDDLEKVPYEEIPSDSGFTIEEISETTEETSYIPEEDESKASKEALLRIQEMRARAHKKAMEDMDE